MVTVQASQRISTFHFFWRKMFKIPKWLFVVKLPIEGSVSLQHDNKRNIPLTPSPLIPTHFDTHALASSFFCESLRLFLACNTLGVYHANAMLIHASLIGIFWPQKEEIEPAWRFDDGGGGGGEEGLVSGVRQSLQVWVCMCVCVQGVSRLYGSVL